MRELINRWEIADSEQYPGMAELTGIDGKLTRYYLCTTPCGRIVLRKSSSPFDTPPVQDHGPRVGTKGQGFNSAASQEGEEK